MKLKLLGWLFIAIMVANLALFVMGRIRPLVFWGIIILVALVAYYGIPALKQT